MNERLKIIRLKLKLTQDDFAKKIGIKQAAISAIEKGIRTVQTEVSMTFAENLMLTKNGFVMVLVKCLYKILIIIKEELLWIMNY